MFGGFLYCNKNKFYKWLRKYLEATINQTFSKYKIKKMVFFTSSTVSLRIFSFVLLNKWHISETFPSFDQRLKDLTCLKQHFLKFIAIFLMNWWSNGHWKFTLQVYLSGLICANPELPRKMPCWRSRIIYLYE